MLALVFVNSNLEVPSFTHTKDTIGPTKLKHWSRDPTPA